ncbi:D-aminoacyl-tRNA deacylase [Psychroflexus tropicus]|uniref:D-aminoacyl-tRNA deacylase n=1 Tax=Psychroflexus tropicus TaxID=197345 RepID=UPI0003671B00|nr:D-aminoacyl-tRNA deacylase [Psychroflexus tropicus]
MKVILQRVMNASVEIDTEISGSINHGLLVYLGIGNSDTKEDMEWLIKKMTQLRIFSDKEGKMNLNINEAEGEFLIVSQFTLHASLKKGNRPSFTAAAKPEEAEEKYQEFVEMLELKQGKQIQTGKFGAHMKVISVNDGPVTFILDSKNKF